MSLDASVRPEAAIIAAVSRLHELGFQGVRVAANHYATGHWRCRVLVPEPGDSIGWAGERNILLAYTNGSGRDVFGDGRTDWDVVALADRLARAAQEVPSAVRPDPQYAAWLTELRRRTAGGWFVMWEDAYLPEQMWEARGLVRLVYADRAAAEADASDPAHSGVDENGWSLSATMPTPPLP